MYYWLVYSGELVYRCSPDILAGGPADLPFCHATYGGCLRCLSEYIRFAKTVPFAVWHTICTRKTFDKSLRFLLTPVDKPIRYCIMTIWVTHSVLLLTAKSAAKPTLSKSLKRDGMRGNSKASWFRRQCPNWQPTSVKFSSVAFVENASMRFSRVVTSQQLLSPVRRCGDFALSLSKITH